MNLKPIFFNVIVTLFLASAHAVNDEFSKLVSDVLGNHWWLISLLLF